MKREYLVESNTGLASYYTLEVNGERNVDAAWYYPHPTPLARKVRDRVAFWRGVKIVRTEEGAASGRRGLLARLGGG